MKSLLLTLISMLLVSACVNSSPDSDSNIVFKNGDDPHVIIYDGNYYLTMQAPSVDSIIIFRSSSVKGLPDAESKLIWVAADNGMAHIYSPELHRIKEKWYLYFEADNGVNTDTHQLFVLENNSHDPFLGKWDLHGPVVTNKDWNFGLHPTTFELNGKQYLLWSGWPKRRTETETQCIYIAEMENPWTLKSDRVMISSPKYEWERQWINPDGSRSAYPIYVNENPAVMLSPDGKNVVVGYSASGIWTVYNTLGIVYAPANSNLLDPASWTKEPEPYFMADKDSNLFGTSNVCVVRDEHGSDNNASCLLFYNTKYYNEDGYEKKDIRWKKMTWNEKGLPEFGKPL